MRIPLTRPRPYLDDARAALLVALIDLPLCLGIAVASGCPPIAGILTAICGGLVASFLGSARLTIKGPAAGMIVVVLGAVQDLGGGDNALGYRRILAVGVAAACLQIVASRLHAGKLCQVIPPSVVHGMLAAIGIIIIAKQVHIMLGVIPHSKMPIALLMELPDSIIHANPRVAIAGLTALSVMLIFFFQPFAALKKVPVAILALGVALPMAIIWHMDVEQSYQMFGQNYELGPKFLVTLPANIMGSLTRPDFSILQTSLAWKHVLLFFLIGSVESLLTVSAVNGLDPERQPADLNDDLFATGVANLVAAAIGGLPMISEVVRSKANIDAGARTVWSNFMHGGFLLLAVAGCASVLHEIPLAALAAMLIFTGLRLLSPKAFLQIYRIGSDQLLLFALTAVVTLTIDLLMGVLSGVVLEAVLHLLRGVPPLALFRLPIQREDAGPLTHLRVNGPAVFSNYLVLNHQICAALGAGRQVRVDFTHAALVDHTTLDRVETFERLNGTRQFQFGGLDRHGSTSAHALATRRLNSLKPSAGCRP